MRSTTNQRGDAGIVLVIVLVLLTLFGVVGLTFTYYAASTDCSNNPTLEIRDGRCIQTIGNDRR